MAMTLEQVRDWHRREAENIHRRVGPDHNAMADALDAHLTQPAQAVDVGAVPFCRVEDVFDNDSMLAQMGVKRGDPLFTRALSAEKAGQAWRCTRSRPTGDGGTHHSLEYAKTEADMLILRDQGYACELLPASTTPGKEG